MAPLSLSQLLDVAIGTPEVGAVNFTALHSLLQAMLGHLGLQDLPAQEPGHSLTPLLGGDQPAKAHPGLERKGDRTEAWDQGTGQQPQELGERLPGKEPLQGTTSSPQVASVAADVGQMKKKIEANESGISKAMALSQDLLEEIGGMKEAQSRMGEDIRTLQETLGLGNLQDAAGQLPGLHDQTTLDSDMKKLKERLSLYPAPEEVSNMEGSGGQSAPAEPHTSDLDTPHGGSSAPGLKAPGTQPVLRTSKGTSGTQPSSQGMHTGMQRAPVTPEKWEGTPSDRTRTSDTNATILGTQPGSPGTKTTTPGMQPGSPGTQTTIPGMQPGSPSTQTTTPGTQPGTPGTQTTIPGTQPGSPGTQTTTLGTQPGSPGTQTTTLGTQPGSPGTQTTTPGTQPGSPSTQTTIPGMQPGSPSIQTTTPGTQPGSPGTKTTTPGTQPGTPSTQTTIPGTQPGTPSTQTTIPGMQPAPPGTQGGGAGVQPSPPRMEPSLSGTEKVPTEAPPGALGTQMDATSPKEGDKALPTTQLAQAGHPAAGTLSLTAQGFEIPLDAYPRAMSPSQEPAVPWGSSGSSSASSRYVETVEALRQIGQLSHLYTALKEQVAQLEATKSDHAELEKLRLLFPEGDQESIASILADLRGQVSSLQGLASDLQGEKGKVRQLEDALGKLGVAGADWKVDGSDQITLQPGSTLQEIKQELKELGEQQEMTKATLEQLVTKTADQLQEQLDELRAMVEGTGQEQEQAEAQAACPVCSTDISVQVGQLLQRYEKLQELVDSFMSRQAVGKVVRQLPGRSQQDEELLKHIQATVMQVQGDYEKLSSVTGNLLDDRHQKQKDIEALFLSLERLEKEKADKEDLVLGIDVKADKTALAGKVSRTQFDASMERLNEMIQEMLSRVMGQEQGWHQVQRQLSEEMDSKLDRLELGPFRQQLEDHWKTILEQLKEKAPQMEADDAAGIKKQLLAHFHCMSCDRPLSMLVPGPHIVAIPSMPPLVPRLAGRPHTILELEQAQQHSHSTTRWSCWARTATSTGAGGMVSCLCSWARRASRGTSPSCPHGSGMSGTPAASSRGPRAPGPRSASRAPPPRRSTGQPRPMATSPRHRGFSRPCGMDPAPRQLGGTGGPWPNPHHPNYRAGEQVAPASSNKGRWAAKRLCGLSGVALGRDLPVMHKEGSAASLKTAPLHPPPGVCAGRAPPDTLWPPRAPFGASGPCQGSLWPQRGSGGAGWCSRRMMMLSCC
ncbi:glutamine-rich protein 2 isoform X1 [Aquila chrysaetos chrysaetos]|uniref:glutamine-rich protein 2 isoform X1 n=1 Tax=Aquila chrysaetos chrysaetos TaxID=223781 RepID=UPI001B7D36CD|nr:glutamine-rich protein 2 isoform X1 [Aquila chrysaetos chrysaetos]